MQTSPQAIQLEMLSAESMWRRRGRKPYGYRSEELPILNRMFSLRVHGFGFDRIAEKLNAESLPSRDGKMWHGLVVNRILSRMTGRRLPLAG